MDEQQAQELAQIVEQKSRAWMDDDLYGAFLRGDIFGTAPQQIHVALTENGKGFVVVAHWEYLDEIFHSIEEWEAFAAKIEERMGLASLPTQSEIEQGGSMNP